MIVGRASNPFIPTSVGALMDPAYLRRAVVDRGQVDAAAMSDTRARWPGRWLERWLEHWRGAALRLRWRHRA